MEGKCAWCDGTHTYDVNHLYNGVVIWFCTLMCKRLWLIKHASNGEWK